MPPLPPQNQISTNYGGYPLEPTGRPPKNNHRLVLVCVLLLVALVVSLIFGFWAFAAMQDYKNNSDKKAAAAVVVAEKSQAEKLAAEFAEKEKSPYKTYNSAADFGAVKIVYPKTWGAYVDESGKGDKPVNAYFHPNFVPAVNGDTPVALRMQVSSESYSQALKNMQDDVDSGKLKASPFVPEQVKTTKGMRFDGQIDSKHKGSLIIIPLRDKTVRIWTEKESHIGDLNSIVLKNLSFVP